jgi:copper(I)-binding protein
MLAPLAMLAACQQSGEPVPSEQQQTPAAPEAKPGLSTSGGVLMLPAVSGRPGAAYFSIVNNSENGVELAAVHVEGALKAEMHETTGGSMAKLEKLPIAPGETVEFAQGGKHVMAFDLDEDLRAGGKTEMTLIFADGDKLSTPIKIEAMGGMDHGSGH